MSEIKWVKITTDMFDNRKIRHLRKLPDGNNIVLIWVMLLTMAGRCNAGGMIFLTENIPYTSKLLADELDFEESTVSLALKALENFGMIATNGEFFEIAGWKKYQSAEEMERIREKNRQRQAKFKEKQKNKGNVMLTLPLTLGNATDKEKEKEGEIISGGGDTRAREEISQSLEALSKKYWSRSLTDFEKKEILDRISSFLLWTKKDHFSEIYELAEIAFDSAAKANAKNLAYISGVFQNFYKRNIRCVDDYWHDEYHRDVIAGRV